ncbi:hypothetical protein PAL_GLEAN10023039 [Pteropus alecto]|uniref:Uncharacterized protein n=1 Tax=Pteropus alecto TaxID=9402 RepID=L5K2P2_PTEAL|nr:hypothetical protein PAL_GLEAN10023039 [Pteropus alecto]
MSENKVKTVQTQVLARKKSPVPVSLVPMVTVLLLDSQDTHTMATRSLCARVGPWALQVASIMGFPTSEWTWAADSGRQHDHSLPGNRATS